MITHFGCPVIRFSPCTSLHLEILGKSQATFGTRHVTKSRHIPSNKAIAMSAPCRLAAGTARKIESCAAPQIGRRTFASCSNHPVAPSRTANGAHIRCLREAKRGSFHIREAASSSQAQMRSFSQSTPRNKLNTIDQIKARNKGGVRFHYATCRPVLMKEMV